MSWSPFSSSAHGGGREGMGGGGRHSPFRHIFSQSLILAFFFFFFLNSIHPLKTTTYEVAKCFLGVMAVAEISRECLRLAVKTTEKEKSHTQVLKPHFALNGCTFHFKNILEASVSK